MALMVVVTVFSFLFMLFKNLHFDDNAPNDGKKGRTTSIICVGYQTKWKALMLHLLSYALICCT